MTGSHSSRRAGVVALVVALLFTACGQEDAAENDAAATAHADPAVVLSAFVDAWSTDKELGSPDAFLFHAMTRPYRSDMKDWDAAAKRLLERLDGLRSDTLDDFARANEDSLDLQELLQTKFTVHFITPEETEALGQTRNSHEWDVTHRKLVRKRPGVRDTRSLSAPGVSADGRQALIYATWHVGARVAQGNYYLLAREEGVWRIVGTAFMWVS